MVRHHERDESYILNTNLGACPLAHDLIPAVSQLSQLSNMFLIIVLVGSVPWTTRRQCPAYVR